MDVPDTCHAIIAVRLGASGEGETYGSFKRSNPNAAVLTDSSAQTFLALEARVTTTAHEAQRAFVQWLSRHLHLTSTLLVNSSSGGSALTVRFLRSTLLRVLQT